MRSIITEDVVIGQRDLKSIYYLREISKSIYSANQSRIYECIYAFYHDKYEYHEETCHHIVNYVAQLGQLDAQERKESIGALMAIREITFETSSSRDNCVH